MSGLVVLLDKTIFAGIDIGKFTVTVLLTNNLISLLINSGRREIWVGAFIKVSTQSGL